jgi:hypothetical protein
MSGPCLSTIGSSTELVSDLLLSLLSELFPELSPSVECFFFFSPFPFCLDFFCAALSAFACSFFSDARSLARVCCSEVQLRISERTPAAYLVRCHYYQDPRSACYVHYTDVQLTDIVCAEICSDFELQSHVNSATATSAIRLTFLPVTPMV